MTSKLILHAGWGKAGSTALQHFLFQNKEQLLSKQGILYPDLFSHKGDTNHNWLAFLLTNAITCEDLDYHELRKQNPWDKLRDTISKTKPKVTILSGEAFSSVFYYDFDNFLESTKGLDIEIVLYHRDLFHFIEAMYNQHIKSGYPESFHQFITSCKVCMARGHAHEVYKNLINHFGKNHVILRLYDKDHLYKKNIITDFAQLAGINTDTLTIPTNDINSRIPNQYLKLCQKINQSSADMFEARHRIQCFVEYVLKHKPSKKTAPIISRNELLSIIDEYQTGEAMIARLYFDNNPTLYLNKYITKQTLQTDNSSFSSRDLVSEIIIPLIDNLSDVRDITMALSNTLNEKNHTIKQLYRALRRLLIKFIPKFLYLGKTTPNTENTQ